MPPPTPAPPPGHETDTAGYLLYPSAATGATLAQQSQFPTQPTQCTPQGITVSGSPVSLPLQGWGVTVAVIDSGFMEMRSQSDWQPLGDSTLFAGGADGRCIIYKDFLPESAANGNIGKNSNQYNSVD